MNGNKSPPKKTGDDCWFIVVTIAYPQHMKNQQALTIGPGLERLLTSKEVAPILHTTARSLAVMRCKRCDHPPYLKVGRKVLYRWTDLIAWLDAHIVNATTPKVGA